MGGRGRRRSAGSHGVAPAPALLLPDPGRRRGRRVAGRHRRREQRVALGAAPLLLPRSAEEAGGGGQSGGRFFVEDFRGPMTACENFDSRWSIGGPSLRLAKLLLAAYKNAFLSSDIAFQKHS